MLVSCQTWLPFKWSILIKILHGPATLVTGARCSIGRAVAISLAAACARIVEKFYAATSRNKRRRRPWHWLYELTSMV